MCVLSHFSKILVAFNYLLFESIKLHIKESENFCCFTHFCKNQLDGAAFNNRFNNNKYRMCVHWEKEWEQYALAGTCKWYYYFNPIDGKIKVWRKKTAKLMGNLYKMWKKQRTCKKWNKSATSVKCTRITSVTLLSYVYCVYIVIDRIGDTCSNYFPFLLVCSNQSAIYRNNQHIFSRKIN